MDTRIAFSIAFIAAAFGIAAQPGTVLAQKKYGMFDPGHVFDPPQFVVFVDKQYTQNGVMDNDMYFITSEKVDGDRVFFAGAQSDVKTIGGPFRTIEELAAVLPEKASAWTGDMTRFAARPAGEPAVGSGSSASSSSQPLKGNIQADLSPDQMADDSGNTGGGGTGGGGAGGGTGRGRRGRITFPPLATLLFGVGPEVGEMKGKVFTVFPDGRTNYLLGTFEIINRDEMRIFPAGGDTIHVMTLQAPAGGVLETDYVHYATTSGGGEAAIPRDDRTRSSGNLDFTLTGGPTVDAMMQQTHIAVAHGPPGGTIATQEDRLAPFPVRFIPDP